MFSLIELVMICPLKIAISKILPESCGKQSGLFMEMTTLSWCLWGQRRLVSCYELGLEN
jgi:hypothetical protein